MGRFIRDEKWLGEAIQPVEITPWESRGPEPDWWQVWFDYEYRRDPIEKSPYSRVRKEAMFQPGDIIYDMDGLCRVVDVFTERVQGTYSIPKYRVQRLTKQGTWSKLWHYTWPGIIQRAYKREGLPCGGGDD